MFHFSGHAFCNEGQPFGSGLVCVPVGDEVGVLTLQAVQDQLMMILLPRSCVRTQTAGELAHKFAEERRKPDDMRLYPYALVSEAWQRFTYDFLKMNVFLRNQFTGQLLPIPESNRCGETIHA